MKKTLFWFMVLFSPSIFVSSCTHRVVSSGTSTSGKVNGQIPSAPCIIYKTKADYSRNVPVILTADKKGIASYPDIKDVYYKGELAYPTPLADGFLLDNRGIGPDVAFLSLTYKEYAVLSKTPSSDELMKLILDKDPVSEMYHCSYRSDYKNLVTDLNETITAGKLDKFKKLK